MHQLWSRSDCIIALAIIVLPWQARWIVGYRLIDGMPYEYGVLSVYAVLAIEVAALAFLAPRMQLRKERAPLAAAVVWLCVASFFASDQLLALWAAGLSIAAFGYYLIARYWDREKLLLSLVSMGLLQAAIGWGQFIAQRVAASTLLGVAEHAPEVLGQSVVVIYGERYLRAYGLLPHPNVFAGVCAVAFLAAVYWYLTTREFKSRARWALQIGSVAFLFSAVLISFSRSALIGLGLGLSLWFVMIALRKTAEQTLRIAQIIAVCLALFFSFSVIAENVWLQRLGVFSETAGQGELDARSADERIVSIYESRVLMNEKVFFLGVGPGNYVLSLARAFPSLPVYAYQPVHNAAILLFFEVGLVGFVIAVRLMKRLLTTASGKIAIYGMFLPFAVCIVVIALVDHYPWSQVSGQALAWTVLGLLTKKSE